MKDTYTIERESWAAPGCVPIREHTLEPTRPFALIVHSGTHQLVLQAYERGELERGCEGIVRG